MSALRLIRNDGCGARGNVALTAAMMELHEEGAIPDTLRIYRYPESVLLGRNQSAKEAADLAECQKRNIEIARRVTGGGAIYMDRGVMTWDLVVSSRVAGGDPRKLSEKVCTVIAERISALGVKASFRAENDVEVQGKKLIGASGYADGSSFIYQGSLMLAPDFEAMAAVLRIPLPALQARVTTLEAVAGRTMKPEETAEMLATSISVALKRFIVEDSLSVRELALRDTLLAGEYGRDEFVFQDVTRAAA